MKNGEIYQAHLNFKFGNIEDAFIRLIE
jgi:hypothetical protein